MVPPTTSDGAAGVTASEASTGALTTRTALPDVPLTVALIVLEPAASAVAMPDAVTLAIFASEELQVAVLV